MNTAYYRVKAHEQERALHWKEAARLYQEALNHYPASLGQLYQADREMLASRAKSCLAMVQVQQ